MSSLSVCSLALLAFKPYRPTVAARRKTQELAELAAFVRDLIERSPYGTAASFARAANYPASNLSEVVNAVASIDGVNLVRLIQTAKVAEAGDAGGAGPSPASSTDQASTAQRRFDQALVDRLAEVEATVVQILDLNERWFRALGQKLDVPEPLAEPGTDRSKPD